MTTSYLNRPITRRDILNMPQIPARLPPGSSQNILTLSSSQLNTSLSMNYEKPQNSKLTTLSDIKILFSIKRCNSCGIFKSTRDFVQLYTCTHIKCRECCEESLRDALIRSKKIANVYCSENGCRGSIILSVFKRRFYAFSKKAEFPPEGQHSVMCLICYCE